MKKYLIFLALLFGISITVAFVWCARKQGLSSPDTIIVLNGPSGAGESSIQRSFQKLSLPHLWVAVGIDDGVMPEITAQNMHFWQAKNEIRWIKTTDDTVGNHIVSLHVGFEGEEVAYAMNSAIAAYA